MVRIGVVGYGLRADGVVQQVLRKLEPAVRVVGIVDPEEAKVRERLGECDREAVFYGDLETMVRRAKLDGLVIGTRCNLHSPYAIEAARYDIPVYLEKPVAISMAQAEGLERAYENSKGAVVVSFPLRVSPLCELAKEYINQGAVGSCEHVAAVNYVPYGAVYFEQEYRNWAITQGLFLQKATHDFDYISYLMGSPIVRVAAMATRGRVFGGDKPAELRCSACGEVGTCAESPQNRRRQGSNPGLPGDHWCDFSVACGNPEEGMNEDSSSALLEFASGVHGVYTQVFFVKRDAGARGATVSGYEGTVSFDWYANEMRWVQHHRPFTNTVKAADGLSHFGGDSELGLDFLGMIREGKKPRTTIWDGIQSVYTCLAAKESAETGRFVAVRQVGRGT